MEQNTVLKQHALNEDMPEFIPSVEIRRLKAVLTQKNMPISHFKDYDECRKEYVKQIETENEQLRCEVKRLESGIKGVEHEKELLTQNLFKARKNKEPMFVPELKSLMESGDMTVSEYERFMKLYAYWLEHRNMVNFYKSRLKTGRQSTKDLMGDIKSIKEILIKAGDMELLDELSSCMLRITAHLDTLMQRLSSAEEDELP